MSLILPASPNTLFLSWAMCSPSLQPGLCLPFSRLCYMTPSLYPRLRTLRSSQSCTLPLILFTYSPLGALCLPSPQCLWLPVPPSTSRHFLLITQKSHQVSPPPENSPWGSSTFITHWFSCSSSVLPGSTLFISSIAEDSSSTVPPW